MIHYKSHKETPRTFSITFDIDDLGDVKKLKAFAIIMGAYNLLRHESIDEDALYEAKKKSNDECDFENMVYDITKLLR